MKKHIHILDICLGTNNMKKNNRLLIVIAFILLIICLFIIFDFSKEEPEYLVLEIPRPQFSSVTPYSSEFANSEEFSTFIWHDSGHKYFVWRMYMNVSLGSEGFNSVEDVENYYDKWIKSLGWKKTESSFCNSQMTEFQPERSYKAYLYSTKYYEQPIACLVIWSEFQDGSFLDVLIKTINPSRNVLSSWD